MNPKVDAKVHATPFRFTVPKTQGKALENVSFEADLARIERGEPANPPTQCDAITGANYTNPPIGSRPCGSRRTSAATCAPTRATAEVTRCMPGRPAGRPGQRLHGYTARMSRDADADGRPA